MIAMYGISLSCRFWGTVGITFPFPSEYNRKTLTVAHCLKDKLNTYGVAVSNGKVTITAGCLSPFVIVDNSKNNLGTGASPLPA